jgi:hypothetical protein
MANSISETFFVCDYNNSQRPPLALGKITVPCSIRIVKDNGEIGFNSSHEHVALDASGEGELFYTHSTPTSPGLLIGSILCTGLIDYEMGSQGVNIRVKITIRQDKAGISGSTSPNVVFDALVDPDNTPFKKDIGTEYTIDTAIDPIVAGSLGQTSDLFECKLGNPEVRLPAVRKPMKPKKIL